MKTAIRIIAGIIVLAALAVAWKWVSLTSMPLKAVKEMPERILDTSYFKFGNLPITPLFFVKALIFVSLLGLGARLGRKVMRNRILARTSLDPGLQYALSVGTGYLIFLSVLRLDCNRWASTFQALPSWVARLGSESELVFSLS